MKNFYDISVGQLVVLWLFGIIGWFWAMSEIRNWNGTSFAAFLIWFVPFFLIFYTTGWRNKRVS